MKIFIFVFLIIVTHSTLYAACTSPSGIAGQSQWVTAESKIKWCNGNNWVDAYVSTSLGCSGITAGTINYDGGDLRFCDGSFWQSMKGPALNSCLGNLPGSFQWDSTRYILKFCDGVTWYAMYVPSAPAMSAIGVNSGATSTRLNNVQMNLSANATDAASNITHFCFKYSTTASIPSAPTASDSCWIPVNFPSPGIQPSTAISFSNYYYSIGFTPATYTIFGWVKNGVDYISALSSAGSGTDLVDKVSIAFDPGAPPVLVNVFATNSDSSPVPPASADLVVGAGSDVFIKWKLTDDRVLPATPVEIYYTTDETNFTLIASGITNSANAGCSIDGTLSTGCYKWTGGAPTSGYFKIRIKATDDSNLSAILSAEPNNMGLFKFLAGTTDPGLGGSAASAVIYTNQPGWQNNSGSGSFVVRDNGTMFIIDDRGLMKIDPVDGNFKLFLPYTGFRTDGALASATLIAKPMRIALDYSDRLLIYDSQFIRRVDFSTGQITSIIGGGGSTADGTDAASFQISPVSVSAQGSLFNPLPNGDIWFQTSPDFHLSTRSSGSGFKLRIYKASDNKVYTLPLTGVGSLEDGAFDPSGYPVYSVGISFNPLTSNVTAIRSRAVIPVSGGHIPRSTSYDPTTGVATAPHIPFLGYWTDDSTITSRTGEMYGVDRFQLQGMFKYNSVTNSWDRILGTGTKGQCVDGTPALSCSVEITDAFVNSQNQVFFIDRGRVRIIDDSGNVLTIFGQSLAFGDGGLAASARVNEVYYLDSTQGGKIAFIDNKEFVLREFTPGGTIQRLAGNGADQAPDTTNPALNQAISVNYWGGIYPMVSNSTTGDIYFTRGGGNISKLDRASGVWVDVAGGGGTHYMSADGLLGNQVSFAGYPMGPLGFNGTSLLRHFYEWDGTQGVNGFLKTFAVTDGLQGPLAGQAGPLGGSIDSCADGVALSACALPSNGNALTRAGWDSGTGQWLLHQNGSNKIRTATAGGNWGTLTTLPRGANAFTYVVKASVPYVYYCSGGQIYKYNVTTSIETALIWPSSTISCFGHSILWHSSRQSIVFPIKQNGLGAIAEIYDP